MPTKSSAYSLGGAGGIDAAQVLNSSRLHGLLGAIIGWALVVTLLRAVRLPNDWAKAHWLVHYGLGTVKRDLPGTILAPLIRSGLGLKYAEAIIQGGSSLLLAGFAVCLCGMTLSIVRSERWSTTGLLLGAVFVTSPFVVMSGHLNGYFDNQFIMLTWLAIGLVSQGRHWPAAIALSIGVPIHESIVLVGFPSVLWSVWAMRCGRLRGDGCGQHALGGRSLIPFSLPLAVFALLVFAQTGLRERTAVRQQLTDHIAQFSFVQRGRDVMVPVALTTGFGEYFRDLGPTVGDRLIAPGYVAGVLPGLALSLAVVWCRIRHWPSARLLVVGAGAACLAPLALLVVAWDMSRIWTYTLVVALTTVWTVSKVVPNDGAVSDGWVVEVLSGVALTANIVSTTPLMDFQVERFTIGGRLLLYAPALIMGAWSWYASRPGRKDGVA